MKNALNTVISEGSLAADPTNLVIGIHIPWYRSLPVSCIAGLEITLDGTPVPLDQASVRIGDHTWPFGELASRTSDVWFIQDEAVVTVPFAGGVPAGETKDVTVRLDTRIPYILVGPDTALTTSVTATETLTAREGAAA